MCGIRKRKELQNEAVGVWDETSFQNGGRRNRPLSHGGHFESQENKKLCFCTATGGPDILLVKYC